MQSEADFNIIACTPVDISKLAVAGIVNYIPPAGAWKINCERCSEPVWIGPRQDQKRKEVPCLTLCIPCAVKHAKAIGAEFQVKHLGGQGGTFEGYNS